MRVELYSSTTLCASQQTIFYKYIKIFIWWTFFLFTPGLAIILEDFSDQDMGIFFPRDCFGTETFSSDFSFPDHELLF